MTTVLDCLIADSAV